MELPYKVESLDDVPEAAREFYQESDGGFVLPVAGVKAEDEVGALERAYERLKKQRDELKGKASQMSKEDLEELEALRAERAKREEEKAKAEGKWEELRGKLAEKHQKELEELRQGLQSRESVIEELTVTNELRAHLNKAGVTDYLDAAEALLMRRGPQVKWQDGKPVGVFPNEVEGDKPIADFVAEWSKTDDAKRFLPPANGAGGGGGGGRPRGDKPSWEGKKYADMTMDEKAAYTEATYGGDAAA